MTAYKNYSISAGKGKLYLKEKQPTEGYEEVTYGTDGKKTYHQYHNNITGTPSFFDVKEIQHEGKTLKFIELNLTDGDTSNKVSAPLKNVKGNYTDETKALISSLYNLELGEPVTLAVKTTTTTGKNNKEYKNLNIYINYVNRLGENGKGLSTGFISYTDIPAPIEKIVAGDKTWDWSPQTEFFYTKLQEVQEKFKGASNTTAPPVAQAPKATIPTASPAEAFAPATQMPDNPNYQDLPF